jgi:ABC-type uncharacterized transport system auxiliary subunit
VHLIAAAGLVAALAACGSVRPSKYYTLSVPAAAPVAGAAAPADVLVGRVTAPQMLRDDRIVYRSSGTQLGAYEYHRWAEPPTEMISELLFRSLRDSGRFRSVQSLRSNARGDILVRGRLYEFGEVTGSPLTGRVKLEVEAYDQQTGKVVFSRMFSADEPVNGKEVADVVAALDSAVKRALSEFTTGFADYCAAHPPKP